MISVIIPVYHNEKALMHTLEAVKEIKQITEIVLVFDGYKPPSPFDDSMWNMYEGTKIISNYPDIPWACSRAKNIGAINSNREWLFFLDVDHRPVPEWFARDVQRLSRASVNLCRREYKGDTAWPVQIAIVDRDLFFKVGGFDERFDGNYGYEDKHFNYKVGKQIHTALEIEFTGQGEARMPRSRFKNEALYEKLIKEWSS